jgi:hypothetical protein
MSSSLTSARYILTVALLRTTLDEASGPRSLRAKNTMCVCVCVCVCACVHACVCVCLCVKETLGGMRCFTATQRAAARTAAPLTHPEYSCARHCLPSRCWHQQHRPSGCGWPKGASLCAPRRRWVPSRRCRGTPMFRARKTADTCAFPHREEEFV